MKLKLLAGCIGLCFLTAAAAQASFQYRVPVRNLGGAGGDAGAGIASVANSCLGPDWAGTIPSGSSITAYQDSTVPYGSSCVSEQRDCLDGALTGYFEAQTCAVAAQPTAVFVDGAETPVPSYYNLGNVYTGESSSVMAGYVKNTGTVPVSLTSAATISGTYASLFASPAIPGGSPDCTSGMVLNSGDKCEFGLQFTPNAAGTANTPISVSYAGGTATKAVQGVGVSSSCTLPWGGSVNTNVDTIAYQTPSVPNGSTCVSETRTCTNSVLSGTYTNATCAPLQPTYATMTLGSAVNVSPNFIGNSGTRVFIGSNGWKDNDMAVATTCKSSGKWYWEVYTVSPGGSSYTGVAYDPSVAYPSLKGIGMYSQGNTYYGGGDPAGLVSGSTVSNALGGVKIGFALDMDNRTLRTYVNGVAKTSNAYLFPIGSCVYPVAGVHTGWGSYDATFNFGQTAFYYSAPSGYTAGFTQ